MKRQSPNRRKYKSFEITPFQEELIINYMPFAKKIAKEFVRERHINHLIGDYEAEAYLALCLNMRPMTKENFKGLKVQYLRNLILRHLELLWKEDLVQPKQYLFENSHQKYKDLENFYNWDEVLESFTPKEKTIIQRYYFGGDSLVEIAEDFSCSVKTIHNVKYDALKKLRRLFNSSTSI